MQKRNGVSADMSRSKEVPDGNGPADTSLRRAKILVVDDCKTTLHCALVTLMHLGHQVTTAESGEVAIALLKSCTFDVVITDLVMGDVGGVEVLRAVKQADATTQVIVHTAHSDFAAVVETLRSGGDDYLVKSASTDELVYRVSRCLEQRDRLQKLRLYEQLLSVCMICRRIRDDAGATPGHGPWKRLEPYLFERAKVNVSHGCCPDCVGTAFPDVDWT
jgi:CheY-like chemotaxis protein